ncbi:MAG: hypothetical protein EOO39_16785 [Cytophagaceae bacterium]|nr:MAG: hypothetical protein EOO39_16785 [Cytophagaceae bacterium]
MPLGCYCRKDNGIFQVWTSKALAEDDFPDRHFIETDSTEGLAEKIVAKFDPNRKFPGTVFITREIPESSYLRKALQKHNIKHDYYVGGEGAHDWGTWRHLLYYRLLPNLWPN